MRRHKYLLLAVVCILCLDPSILFAKPTAPERLAAFYFAKLREGDMESIAKFIDVKDLAAFREKLIPVFDAGFFDDLPPEALQILAGGDDLLTVKAYAPDKFFQRFLEMFIFLEPEAKERLSQFTTEVIGSVPEKTDTEQFAHVLVRMVPKDEPDSRVSVLVLTARLHNRKWRLLIPQDISQTVEILHAYAMVKDSVEADFQDLIDAGPEKAYTEIINMLSAGRQADAEEALASLSQAFPKDQPLAFLQAVCSRSRWAKNRAAWQFRHVLELDPSTVEGKAARYMLDLDDRKMIRENMNGLHILIDQNPDNPLLLWLLGIACQDNFKHTEKTTYDQEGAKSYRALLEKWEVGPVLLHQTFANILSEQLDLEEEALVHRRKAVELEPKSWTYQGLANTLTGLERYDEADQAFEKIIELDPDDYRYWLNWASMLREAKRYDESVQKCVKVIELNPSNADVHQIWGDGLWRSGKPDEALVIYKKGISIKPDNYSLYKRAAGVLKELGRADESAEMMKKLNELYGW